MSTDPNNATDSNVTAADREAAGLAALRSMGTANDADPHGYTLKDVETAVTRVVDGLEKLMQDYKGK